MSVSMSPSAVAILRPENNYKVWMKILINTKHLGNTTICKANNNNN